MKFFREIGMLEGEETEYLVVERGEGCVCEGRVDVVVGLVGVCVGGVAARGEEGYLA
jgi:hypothetical protein